MGTYAITGGMSGIGAGIVQLLRAEGHKLIVADLKGADVNADLSTPEGRAATVQGIAALAPDGLDGFIPCAGISGIHKPAAKVGAVNYFAVIETTLGVMNLLEKKQGSVVFISSITASMASEDAVVDAMLAGDEAAASGLLNDRDDGNLAYAASKRAVACWMRQNCPLMLKKGVRMNAIGPGFIDTPLNDAIAKDPVAGKINQDFAETIPIGRRGTPEDIAKAVSFLMSDNASFIAGTLLFVDGGHDALLRPTTF